MPACHGLLDATAIMMAAAMAVCRSTLAVSKLESMRLVKKSCCAWTCKFNRLKKKKNFSSFGQPTRLITCANHGNTVICS